MAALQRDQEGGDDRDQRDAARQAVEAVDQVHRVDDADDPEQRERQARPSRAQIGSPNGLASASTRKPSVIHAARRPANWTRNFFQRVRAAQVVVEAEDRDGECRPTNRPMTCSRSARNSCADAALEEQQADQRRVERDDDGDAAQPRDRLAVNLARRQRVVERAEAVRQPAHERRQERPAEHREDESDGGGSHRCLTPSRRRVRTQFPSARTSIRVLR